MRKIQPETIILSNSRDNLDNRDFIISEDGIPHIIDVNDFPSFRSIPEAVSLISDYIYNVVKMQQQLVRITARTKN